MNKRISIFLFIIILIGGYVSLALELLAIRQVIPYLGSDTIIVSIIIGVVLIFLSIGYYTSGKIDIKKTSIRDRILKNFIISTIFIFIGTTYIFLKYYFIAFEYMGITNRIAQAFSFSLLFLAIPSYLLAQTTPLVSNYFSKNISAKATGQMLFYGTIGSFAGSILTTLFIMPLFGVNYAVMFNIFLMSIAILILNKRSRIEIYISGFLFLVLVFFFNNSVLEHKMGIITNNNISTVKILDTDQGRSRLMVINNSASSKISDSDDLMFEYVKYINNNYVYNIPTGESPKDILVLGAGGFTIGAADSYNNYTYVDIDRKLLDISEEYFLNKKLDPNKKFLVKDARIFVQNTGEKYDLVILDTYSHKWDIPTHLATVEYFESIKKIIKPNGIMVANIIMSANFEDRFSIILDNTLRHVFGNLQRQAIFNFNPWEKNENLNYINNIYVYYNNENSGLNKIYSDNNNSVVFDKMR